jgi:hypothetical protein
MKLKEFIENLQKFVEQNPKALKMEVVTSKDDEGNGYNIVYYGPSIGNYDSGVFTSHSEFEDWNLDDDDLNSVCLN